MYWLACFVGGVGILALSIAVALISVFSSGRRRPDPLKVLFAGVVLCAAIVFVPLYIVEFRNTDCGPIETLFIALHNTVRLFVVDGDFQFIVSHLKGTAYPGLASAYSVLFSVLFLAAPLLTFGFALTFFRNIAACQQYLLHYRADAYVFSELNDKSLALATSLRENGPWRLLVFTGISDEEAQQGRLQQAKALGAVCFSQDITTPVFARHSRKKPLRFFVMGEDSAENIRLALVLLERYRLREQGELFVSSIREEADWLLCNASGTDGGRKLRVRRMHEVRSLIQHTLYEQGYEAVFGSAQEGKITAVVVGLGHHGKEMAKALPWFCQMDGYSWELHAFEKDPLAAERFALDCPELMGPASYDSTVPGCEEPYRLFVHGSIDVETRAFADRLQTMPPATYVFVSLGDDERNISAAIRLRQWYERMGQHPYIHAIVYDGGKKAIMEGIANHKGQSYDIHFIGDLDTAYSEAVLLNSEVEQAALARHCRWGAADGFWQYAYNYRSSIASAIHGVMKRKCGVPGADVPPEQRTEEELWGIRRLEHRRWNAYMRSEGYVYGPERNDLAKTHPCLVPFEALSEDQQAKDDD